MMDNPFPGLRPFKTEETHLFFGREGQINEVLEKLNINRFIAILGSSGSGKSSLMYCGLIPNLYSGFIGESGSFWKTIITRPGVNPTENLADTLTRQYHKPEEPDFLLKKNINAAILRSSSTGLAEVIQNYRIENNTHFLLVIDQFEEIFRYKRLTKKSSTDDSTSYIELFIEAIRQTTIPIYVVVTMRSDYIGDCASFPMLTSYINKSYYLVPQMTRRDKKGVIKGPIMVSGNKITDQLEIHILNTLEQKQDQLPILQHALMRTWGYWNVENKSEVAIDLGHYEKIGGMANALSIHADEAYTSLSKDEQRICQQLFQTITEREENGRGIRRPTDLQTISEITEAQFKKLGRVIDEFRQKDRGFLMPALPEKLTPQTIIDISHESLMRVWDRCRDWVDEELINKKNYLTLCGRSEQYRIGKEEYLKPPELEILWEWYKKYKPSQKWGERYDKNFIPAIEFLKTSKEIYDNAIIAEERRQKAKIRNSIYLSIGAAIFAIILVFVAIFAQTQATAATSAKKEAEKSAQIAQEEQKKAQDEQKKAQEEQKKAEEQKRIAEEQKVIALNEKQRAQKQEKKAEQAAEAAEKERKEAEKLRAFAEVSQDDAENAKDDAEKAKDEAEAQKELATLYRNVSVAKSMAIRANTIKNERLKILLAQYSYEMNRDANVDNVAGGFSHDADIYSALYVANRVLDKIIPEQKKHMGLIHSLHISKNEPTFYSASSDGQVLKWSIDSLKLIEPVIQTNYAFRSMDISKDDRYLIIGTSEAGIHIFDLENRNEDNNLASEIAYRDVDNVTKDVFIKPTNNKDFLYVEDTLLFQYSLDESKQQQLIDYKNQGITRFIYHEPTNKTFLATTSGSILAFENDEKNTLKTLDINIIGQITSMTFVPKKNSKLMIGTDKGEIVVYDLGMDTTEHVIEAHDGEVVALQVSSNSKFMASGGYDRKVNVWLTDYLNKLPMVLNDHHEWVTSFLFLPNEEKIIVGYKDGVLKIYPLVFEEMSSNICEALKKRNQEENNTYKMTPREWDLFTDNIELKDICVDE